MKKRNHIWFGIIFVFAFIFVLNMFHIDIFKFTLSSIAIIVAVTIFYSLLPDIDHKNSSITWFFFGIGIIGIIIGMIMLLSNSSKINTFILLLVSTIFLVSTFIASNFLGHRGIVHSIPAGLLAVIPLLFIFHNLSYCLVAYVSWHSHLIGDGYLLKWR
jgi:hypothetical protein